LRRALVTLVFAIAGLVALSAPAHAQAETIGGTIQVAEDGERAPVTGVVIAISSDGEDIGTGTSDDSGIWTVDVPGPGTYQAELDVASLPDGVAPTDPDGTVLDSVVVRAGQNKVIAFRLGEGSGAAASRYERLGNLFVLGLKLGAIIALSAVGLSLIYGVTGLINFAHGELLTFGALMLYFFHVSGGGPGWPLLLAAVPAVILGGLFGGAQDRLLWRPLRKRRIGNIAMMVVSIGLALALRNIFLIIFNGQPRSLRDFAIQDTVDILGVPVVPKTLVIIGASLVILTCVGLFLQKTKTGIAVRAIADNKDLAESSGIDVQKIILATWILGAGLAALSGIFFGVSESVQYNMGFRLLLLTFAATVLGGLGTAYGAMLGGFVIGIALEVSTYWIDTELKNAVALGLLIVMLLFRPQGLLGRKERLG
jgi:neutral amino acid transport system permease protein